MTSADQVAVLLERVAHLEARLNASSDAFEDHVIVNNTVQDTMWVVLTATLIVLMQLGFAMLEAGSVRSHNAIATYAKNMLDFVHGTIAAVTASYWIANGVHPLLPHSLDVAGITHRSFFQYLAFQVSFHLLLCP